MRANEGNGNLSKIQATPKEETETIAQSKIQVVEETRGFTRTYSQYVQTIASLRAFASELSHAVQESARKAGEFVKEAAAAMVKSLGFSSLDEFKEEIVAGEAKVKTESPSESNSLPPAIQERILSAKPDRKALRTAIIVSLRLMNRAMKYFPHQQIMRGGVLMSLVGAFEVLLSDLLRLYYECHPGALESEEKIYSFNDVRSFGNLDEFLDHVIETKIDGFLRGSLADWTKFFQRMKIDVTGFAAPWEGFAERFQRRHVIIHNGGRVSRQYLKRVDPNWTEQHKEEAQLGKMLQVNDEYLVKAFELFELVGSLLCQEFWKRFARDEREQRGRGFRCAPNECLVDTKWTVAEGLGWWAVSDGDMTASYALIARINRWLSIKRQNRWPEVQTEVKGFDYSVLDSRYIAAIHALTGNTDLFFAVLPKAGIPQDELRSWPIFEEMRQDLCFQEFLEKSVT
jgi:hypothetical protein